MLTFLAVPKAFQGHVNLIQRNAIASWTRLEPTPRVVLFGDELGTAEAARELGLTHVAGVPRNELGTPLLDFVIRHGEGLAPEGRLCFVNADIVLTSDFSAAVTAADAAGSASLIVGRRTNLDVREALDLGGNWEARLRERARVAGAVQPPCYIDYFVFFAGLWGEIPPFAVGRICFDNWLIYRARERGVRVIDATDAILAVHQNHDYHHVPITQDPWTGPEAARNLALAGGAEHLYDINDATHVLRDGKVRPALGRRHLRRRLVTTAQLSPALRLPAKMLLGLADLTFSLRRRFGLALNPTGQRR